MNFFRFLIVCVMVLLISSACSEEVQDTTVETETSEILEEKIDDSKEEESTNNKHDHEVLEKDIIDKYSQVKPKDWGENIEGVITQIDVDKKIVALTFDACDGRPGYYDEDLINFLIKEEIPATLFVSGEWIKQNKETFIMLSENPLLEIANHGYKHKPLSVSGKSAYNIPGTASVEEVFNEVYKNQLLIKKITGEYPKYFRSGTAHYDDVAVDIIYDLGLKPVNYNVLGDAGGTFDKQQIAYALESANPGSIMLLHMNQPESDIAQGVKDGVKRLRQKSFEFVRLADYDEYLN
ncbi:polysaccharide deacetylase family protein [Proteinivorax hydrogeniformans]|uniref:Polysaccharide deacetylase family protein n=1 Tax=Proteinivorax hydrogeniformans TaxID=1826727 RepID=A0AAU8HRL9_9FIRM